MTTQKVEVVHNVLQSDWDSSVGDLLRLYRSVDKRALELPTVSIVPFLIFIWSVLKFYLFVLADLLLIVPINLIIFIRNCLPGRWSYRVFSWPYIKYGVLWLWRGEFYVPTLFIRPLTTFLLSMHFRKNLLKVRRHLLVDVDMSEENRSSLMAKVDKAFAIWQGPKLASVLFTYGLSLLGPLMELWKAFGPGELPTWTRSVVVISISYALTVLGTAFLVKRGLMLGGAGRAVYFPGSLMQQGCYAEEKTILASLGIRSIEFPVDIGIYIVGILLNLLTWEELMYFYGTTLSPEELERMWFYGLVPIPISIILIVVVWLRRKRLNRG